jgi:hypothetical protein
VHTGLWSRPELEDLYASAHVLLAPSRHEGLNLPTLEFQATGGVVIATDWGGHKTWLDSAYSYPLEFTLQPSPPARGGPEAQEAQASKQHLKELMWHLYTHRDEARDKGRRAAEVVPVRCSWATALDRLFGAVAETGPAGAAVAEMDEASRVRAGAVSGIGPRGGRSEWPIIVGGCPRTGTSLVRRMLDAHPNIHCGPELYFFPDLEGLSPVLDRPDAVDPFGHLRFGATARAVASDAELVQLFGRAFVELHQRLAARAGKPRWADKLPHNLLYLEQWQQLLGDEWLLVHVVRNPLDVVASRKEMLATQWGRRPATPELAAYRVPANWLDATIEQYRRYHDLAAAFARSNPNRARLLVYEQLVETPEEMLTDLMAWLGEAFDERQLRFNEVRHERGLEDRKVATTSEPHRASVGRWPEILTGDEAAIVWEQTRDLWERFDPAGRFAGAPAASPT